MIIFLEAADVDIWDAVENGHFVPFTIFENDIQKVEPKSEWSDDDEKKVGYNARVKNIITYALRRDQFYKVSNCKTSKEM